MSRVMLIKLKFKFICMLPLLFILTRTEKFASHLLLFFYRILWPDSFPKILFEPPQIREPVGIMDPRGRISASTWLKPGHVSLNAPPCDLADQLEEKAYVIG